MEKLQFALHNRKLWNIIIIVSEENLMFNISLSASVAVVPFALLVRLPLFPPMGWLVTGSVLWVTRSAAPWRPRVTNGEAGQGPRCLHTRHWSLPATTTSTLRLQLRYSLSLSIYLLPMVHKSGSEKLSIIFLIRFSSTGYYNFVRHLEKNSRFLALLFHEDGHSFAARDVVIQLGSPTHFIFLLSYSPHRVDQ